MNISTNTLTYTHANRLLSGEIVATTGDAEAMLCLDLPIDELTLNLKPDEVINGQVSIKISNPGGACWAKPATPAGWLFAICPRLAGDLDNDGDVDGGDLGKCLADWSANGGAALGAVLADTGKTEKPAMWGAAALAGAGGMNATISPFANSPVQCSGPATFRLRITVSPHTQIRVVVDATLLADLPADS